MKKLYFTIALGMNLVNISTYAQALYTQTGVDKSWLDIKKDKDIPIGVTSTKGITGSKIDVKNDLVEGGLFKGYGIEQNIGIHTLGNAGVDRADFPKWSRWYQEEGKTQIFRLFKDEHNVRNDRPKAPRIEAESKETYDGKDKKWHEWVGRFTIVKAQEVNLFQVFSQPEGGGGPTGVMMIGLKANGDIYWNKRDGKTFKTMATKMEGKSIDIKVRDNGFSYEIYINGDLFIAENSQKRIASTHFRWGMYGAENMPGDAIVFVSHAQVDGKSSNLSIDEVSGIEKTVPVYPNPSASGVFRLENPSYHDLFNVVGQKVMSGNSDIIDLSFQPSGVYFLKLPDSRPVRLVRE
jgi:hypothetical protein